jgi:hypothetical protein
MTPFRRRGLIFAVIGVALAGALAAWADLPHRSGSIPGASYDVRGVPCRIGTRPRLSISRVDPKRGHVGNGPTVLGCAGRGAESIQLVGYQLIFSGTQETCIAIDRPPREDSVRGLCQPRDISWDRLCRRLCLVSDVGMDYAGTKKPTRSAVLGVSRLPVEKLNVEARVGNGFRKVPTAVGSLPASFQSEGRPLAFVAATLPRCLPPQALRIVSTESSGSVIVAEDKALLDPCAGF